MCTVIHKCQLQRLFRPSSIFIPELLDLRWELETRRHQSSNHQSTKPCPPTNIAVLGGGITGLATAYLARQRYPSAQITLLERSSRLGGVIESTKEHLDSSTSVVCEKGPRTLRAHAPRALVTYDLVSSQSLPCTDPLSHNQYSTPARILHDLG